MAKVKPSIRPTETYTEPNFLRLHTAAGDGESTRVVTIEHLAYSADSEGQATRGWTCLTIVDNEMMTKEDALFIARNYAAENDIPVIYECHSD
jgi:hypothetical protein